MFWFCFYSILLSIPCFKQPCLLFNNLIVFKINIFGNIRCPLPSIFYIEICFPVRFLVVRKLYYLRPSMSIHCFVNNIVVGRCSLYISKWSVSVPRSLWKTARVKKEKCSAFRHGLLILKKFFCFKLLCGYALAKHTSKFDVLFSFVLNRAKHWLFRVYWHALFWQKHKLAGISTLFDCLP